MNKYHLLLLFLNLFLGLNSYGNNQCLDLFRVAQKQSLVAVSEDPFVTLRSALTQGSGDLTLLIHQSVLKIAADSKYHDKIKDFVRELVEMDRNRKSSRSQVLILHSNIILDPVAKFIHLTKFLLMLIEGDMSLWQGVLTESHAQSFFEDFDNQHTLGHLLTVMPKEWRSKTLQFLGHKYAIGKNYAVIQPIHALMNPKDLYLQYKRDGKTDRDFYNDYLSLLKKDVFSSEKIGGYSGDVVIGIAKIIQSEMVRLKSKGIKAANFFGSVVNGFGRQASDLDVFNHPIEEEHPSLLLQKKTWQTLRLRREDPFDMFRYQIKDEELQKKIDEYLVGSDWQWHLEDLGQTAAEHFGANRHVFIFHITQDRVVLRFYPNYLHVDYAGNPVNYREFIELNID